MEQVREVVRALDRGTGIGYSRLTMKREKKKPREKAYILVRRIQIRRCMERGYTTIADLAARFGLSTMIIQKDVDAIYKEWRKSVTPEDLDRSLALRTSQLEKVLTQADEDHERSRQDDTTVRTTITPWSCGACRGTGFEAGTDGWCPECGGEGEVTEEVTVTSVRGQAGDAQHLRVKLEAVRELNRMGGHTEKEGKGEAPINNLYLGWTPAMLIEAMKAVEEVRMRRKIVDAVSVEVVEGGG